MTVKTGWYLDPQTGQLKMYTVSDGKSDGRRNQGLDIACAIPSRTTREEPIMDKIRFAETLDVQDPELQLLSFVINEEFYDAVLVLESMSPKDRAILAFHLGQLLDMTTEVAVQKKPWTGTGA